MQKKFIKKNIKNYEVSSIIARMREVIQLLKNLLRSKLKAYAYKSLFILKFNLIIQFRSLAFYVFIDSVRFKNL